MGKRNRSRGIVRARKKQKLLEESELHETNYVMPQRQNEGFDKFVEFYSHQNILEDNEWNDFLYYLQQPLPVSFRVTQNIGYMNSIDQCKKSARRLFNENEPIYDNGIEIPPPFYMEWCNAWQLGCDLEYLRNSDHPILQKIHNWILKYTSLGAIIRQETVSMLPVAFLQIEPHHQVLDLCAAPGSKTTQVMDGIFSKGEENVKGFIIANDLDPKRAYMLVRRCAVLSNACQHLMITCHKAQKFPDVYFNPNPNEKQIISNKGFDRIVCDVPCCGDGTLRKTRALFKRWNCFIGVNLHSLQIQIALRGISLLKVGGIMAYSTCTFNPLENEAVVATLLNQCKGSIELLDCSNIFPEIDRRPGLNTWKVFNDEMEYFPTYLSSQQSKNEKERVCFRESMWPPKHNKFPLERCMRFLPHLQDTGGFFVALIKKVKELEHKPTPNSQNIKMVHKIVSKFETKHNYYPITNDASETLQQYFKISKSGKFFKKIIPNLYMRSERIG